MTFLIAMVWFTNGLLCKILDLVPRHQQIVSEILGAEHAVILTKVIGIAEILMSIWILSGIKSKINAIFQILVVFTMNLLEFFLVPHLLLWGGINLVFAILFMAIIYYNEFVLRKNLSLHT